MYNYTSTTSTLKPLSRLVRDEINAKFGERPKHFRFERDEFSFPAGGSICEHVLFRLIDRVTDAKHSWQGEDSERNDAFRKFIFRNLAPGIESLKLALTADGDRLFLTAKAIYRVNAKPDWRECIEREVERRIDKAVTEVCEKERTRRRTKLVRWPKVWICLNDYQSGTIFLQYKTHKKPAEHSVSFRDIIPDLFGTHPTIKESARKIDLEIKIIDEFMRLGMSDVVAPNLAARL